MQNQYGHYKIKAFQEIQSTKLDQLLQNLSSRDKIKPSEGFEW